MVSKLRRPDALISAFSSSAQRRFALVSTVLLLGSGLSACTTTAVVDDVAGEAGRRTTESSAAVADKTVDQGVSLTELRVQKAREALPDIVASIEQKLAEGNGSEAFYAFMVGLQATRQVDRHDDNRSLLESELLDRYFYPVYKLYLDSGLVELSQAGQPQTAWEPVYLALHLMDMIHAYPEFFADFEDRVLAAAIAVLERYGHNPDEANLLEAFGFYIDQQFGKALSVENRHRLNNAMATLLDTRLETFFDQVDSATNGLLHTYAQSLGLVWGYSRFDVEVDKLKPQQRALEQQLLVDHRSRINPDYPWAEYFHRRMLWILADEPAPVRPGPLNPDQRAIAVTGSSRCPVQGGQYQTWRLNPLAAHISMPGYETTRPGLTLAVRFSACSQTSEPRYRDVLKYRSVQVTEIIKVPVYENVVELEEVTTTGFIPDMGQTDKCLRAVNDRCVSGYRTATRAPEAKPQTMYFPRATRKRVGYEEKRVLRTVAEPYYEKAPDGMKQKVSVSGELLVTDQGQTEVYPFTINQQGHPIAVMSSTRHRLQALMATQSRERYQLREYLEDEDVLRRQLRSSTNDDQRENAYFALAALGKPVIPVSSENGERPAVLFDRYGFRQDGLSNDRLESLLNGVGRLGLKGYYMAETWLPARLPEELFDRRPYVNNYPISAATSAFLQML